MYILHLSAVKLLFQEWQVRDLSSPAWTLTLRAIAYSAGPQPDHRSAVTKEDLIKLVAVWDTDPSLVPLRVALVFGFFGYLGISNLAPPTAQSFDPARHSSWADFKPSKQGLLLYLKWTKTLQTQRGVTTIPLAALQDTHIFPVATWDLYRHMFPGSSQTKRPRSCSPLRHRWGRPSQRPPSGPCSTEQQIQQVCPVNSIPLTASGREELLSLKFLLALARRQQPAQGPARLSNCARFS